MKKIISMLLALMLILSLTTTAFAVDSKLTIKTTAGHTYKVYQLLTGDVSGLEDGSGTLANVEAGSSLKDNTTVAAFDAGIKGTDGNYLQNEELANAAYSFVNTGKPVATVIGDGTDKVTNVANGYYIVVDSWTDNKEIDNDALSRYMVAVVGDTTMKPKVAKPVIDKKIIDTDANKAIDEDTKKTDTAAIGDTIEYEITSKVPNTEGYNYYYYVVHDTMSKGLTLVENSFEVKVGGDTLVKKTDYEVYVTNNPDGTTYFELAFANMKDLVDKGTIAVDEAISIKYKATVNDKAEIGLNPNTNTAKLEYSNNPGESERNDEENKPGIPKPGTATGEGPDNITKTYVTELTIDKVDNKGMVLTGAEFTLTGTNLNKVIIKTATEFKAAGVGETAEYYELNDGSFTLKPPVTDKDAEDYNATLYKTPEKPTHVRVVNVTTSTEVTGDTKAITAAVDDSGRITFTGLNAGEYTLTESKTPEGYNTIEPITFTISASLSDTDETTITWVSNNNSIVLDATNGVFNAEIQNMPGVELPETGGMGTTLLYVVGGIMVLAAIVLLITKKRMHAAE